MALSSLFYGMEAYLDGDVEINNNVTTPEEDAVAAADQSAEIANDVADASTEAKDNEIQAQMLVQASKLYTHVKTYGIDRTFLSIYNANGELDKVCGVRFPSCESFAVTGNPRDQYSTRFIAAMEDEGKGLWNWIKNAFQRAWEWIKEKASWIWSKITDFWDWIKKQFKRLVDFFKRDKTPKNVGKDTEATVDAAKQYAEAMKKADADKKEIERLTRELKETTARAVKAEKELATTQKDATALKQLLEESKQKTEEITKTLEESQKKLTQVQTQADADRKSANEKIKKLEEERAAAEAKATAAAKELQKKKDEDEAYRKQQDTIIWREREAERKAAEAQKEAEEYERKLTTKQRLEANGVSIPNEREYVNDRRFANKVADLLMTLDHYSTDDDRYADILRNGIEEVLLQAKAVLNNKLVLEDYPGARTKREWYAELSLISKNLAAAIIGASARLENILAIIQHESGSLLSISKDTLQKIRAEINSDSMTKFYKNADQKIHDVDHLSGMYDEDYLKDHGINIYGDSVKSYSITH